VCVGTFVAVAVRDRVPDVVLVQVKEDVMVAVAVPVLVIVCGVE